MQYPCNQVENVNPISGIETEGADLTFHNLLQRLRPSLFNNEEATKLMKRRFPGDYQIVKYYDKRIELYRFSVVFPTSQSKMWFTLKYGE